MVLLAVSAEFGCLNYVDVDRILAFFPPCHHGTQRGFPIVIKERGGFFWCISSFQYFYFDQIIWLVFDSPATAEPRAGWLFFVSNCQLDDNLAVGVVLGIR